MRRERDTPAVHVDDLASDGEPEAAATLCGGSAVVQADESFEDPVAVLGRDPRAVVAHVDMAVVAVRPYPEHDLTVRVPGGVVGEVTQGAREVMRVAGHPHGADLGVHREPRMVG